MTEKIWDRISRLLFGRVPIEKNVDRTYAQHDDVNFTATIANRVATIAMLDSTVSIVGDSARAAFMREFLDSFVQDKMAVGAEVSLGTGDCLLKPWTDGQRIGVDIVANADFRVVESVGDFLKAVIIKADELKRGDKTYYRYEGQRLVDGDLYIDQMVYIGDVQLTRTEDWPEAWQEIKQTEIIPNVDGLLLGRYKCPTIKRDDVNSEQGVPVTYGLKNVLDEATKAYHRFTSEQEKGESMLFVDRTLFKADPVTGKRELPQGKNKLFQTVQGRDAGDMVREYAPSLRTADLSVGVDVNLKMLELLAGFSAGVLTAPTTNYATATEIKASLNQTYAFITRFRARLIKGTDELLRAVEVIANRNNLTPMGSWEVHYDWSSAYIESVEEQFSRLVTGLNVGAISPEEVRAYITDEALDVAKERVDELRAEAQAQIAAQMGDVV